MKTNFLLFFVVFFLFLSVNGYAIAMTEQTVWNERYDQTRVPTDFRNDTIIPYNV